MPERKKYVKIITRCSECPGCFETKDPISPPWCAKHKARLVGMEDANDHSFEIPEWCPLTYT